MHDPSSASSKPRGQATPPPLPPRVVTGAEAVTKPQAEPRPEPKAEGMAAAVGQSKPDLPPTRRASVEIPAVRTEPRTEPRIELRIQPIPGAPVGDFVPTTLSPQRKQALYWGGGGFVTGIIFWHAVGFWDVVHSAIFSGTHIEASRSVSPPSSPPSRMTASMPASFADAIDRAISSAPSEPGSATITTGAVPPPGETHPIASNCASFTRNPETGQVQSRPCSSAERLLPDNPDSERENFAETKASPGTSTADSRWLHGASANVD